MNKPHFSRREIIARILELIKPHSMAVLVSLVFAMVNVACSLYIPILIGKGIDNIISAGKVDFVSVTNYLLKVLVAVIIGALAQYVLSLLSNKISYVIVRDLRNTAFAKIWRLPLKYIDSHPSGDIISRVISDADQFADGLLLGFTQLFSGVATIVGTLMFMLSLNVYITLVVVIITPLSFFVAKYIATHTYDLFSKQSKIRGVQTAHIEESLSQIKVLSAFGYEDKAEEKFNSINNDLKDVSMFALFYSSLTNPATRFVNSVIYAFVALSGAIAVISGGMTVGIWSCFLNYANQYTKPFNEITGVITELQGAFACAARIFEILDEVEESQDSENAYAFESVEGNISVQDVDFSYDIDKPLIEKFNLEVRKGQKIAIVGPTGSGKTTFINLLMRFYDPINGKLYVDGHDISGVTRDSLRSVYGMVLQDTWLRSATIADNIRMGKPDASMDEVIKAAKESHAHSFIRKMEKGYDTVISEDGGSLSAGQKQLLCIARIMLMRPPMLILDEATSSIDTRTEIKIQNAFLKLMESRTSFIVAHRLSTIVNSDMIIVMNNGHIVEQGKHEELLKNGGFYSRLYNAGTSGGIDE